MANTPPNSSRSHPYGSRNSRVARRNTGLPRASPYPTQNNLNDQSHRQAITSQWRWLSNRLNTWRDEEGIQLPASNGGSSSMEISPYTQEPAHFTVPVLAARLHRHEQRLRTMDIELQETNENWRLTSLERINQVSEDHENTVTNLDTLDNRMGETIETMEVVHNQVIGNRNEISVLQSRLNQCETRLRETEDALRMVSRLAESVDHLTALLPQLNLRQN